MYKDKTVLLLGTNLGDKNNNLLNAKNLIYNEIGSILQETEIIETKPLGFISSNNFLNQIIIIKSNFSPIKLLKKLQKIEKILGRENKSKSNFYEDRIIDIDILFYNNIYFKSKDLEIPHKKNINEREFCKVLISKLE